MLRKAVLFLFGATLLSSCASTYVAPISGSTAKVKLGLGDGASGAGPISLFTYKDSATCSGEAYITRKIGDEALVLADQPITLATSVMPIATKTCLSAATFTPERGATYLVEARFSVYGCRTNIKQLVGTQQVPIAAKSRAMQRAMTASGAFCS